MKPRKVKNVKVPNRGLLSSERSKRQRSHGGSPKGAGGDASMHDGANGTADESTNDTITGRGNHKGGLNNRHSTVNELEDQAFKEYVKASLDEDDRLLMETLHAVQTKTLVKYVKETIKNATDFTKPPIGPLSGMRPQTSIHELSVED
jgi:hypothetical protein